jgi:arginyl-tRNA synthetase
VIEKQIAGLVREALDSAARAGELVPSHTVEFDVHRPRQPEHGDWSTNAALVLQKVADKPPRQIAETIVKHFPEREWITSVEIAGPGFLNFRLSQTWLHETVKDVLKRGPAFGSSDVGASTSVNVEFVSINPTGPLHIGSARNAALGDSIARLLELTGHKVTREYYFNDAGSQMTNFGLSVAERYLELLGREAAIPEDGYFGDYVIDIARRILDEEGDGYAGLDREELGEVMRQKAYRITRSWVEATLERFGIEMDVWFLERSLYEDGKVDAVIDRLDALGYVYEQDGARWLRATELGDTRDRVLVRSFGSREPTYIVPDLAYHLDKAGRGFDRMIVVLGADHSGQAPTLKAGMKALGVDPDRIEVVIYQWLHLMRGGEAVSMGRRSGNFVTLEELMDQVGVDAARYHLLQTSADNTMYFDLAEVARQSDENPVYYVQYAHARIASIYRNAGRAAPDPSDVDWSLLRTEPELALMRELAEFEQVVDLAARGRAPHRVARYAEELARAFSAFYSECRVLTDDEALTTARLALSAATKQVLANALQLLGVSAPERMEREAA